MSGKKVKIMAEGAMLASLFGVLGIINVYTGTVFDVVFAYLMTLGLCYYTYMYDYQAGLSVIPVTFIVLFMVGDLFFTFFSSLTLILGVFYGYCLRRDKSRRFARNGLMLLSLVKNLVIFYLLGSLLGLNAYQEGLEMYQELINAIPFIKTICSPTMLLIGLEVLLFVGEAYIIIIYFQLLFRKMKRRR